MGQSFPAPLPSPMFSYSFTVALASLLYTVAPESLSSYGGAGGRDGGGGGDYDYPEGSLEDTIPGTPGVDYPILAEVPDTGFSCDGRVSLTTTRPWKINIKLIQGCNQLSYDKVGGELGGRGELGEEG